MDLPSVIMKTEHYCVCTLLVNAFASQKVLAVNSYSVCQMLDVHHHTTAVNFSISRKIEASV